MDFTSLAIGIVALLYGFYSIYARSKNPEKFWKLEQMKRFWGEKWGHRIHFIGYSLLPIIFGAVLISRTFFGEQIEEQIEIDHCLDMGGRWLESESRCQN